MADGTIREARHIVRGELSKVEGNLAAAYASLSGRPGLTQEQALELVDAADAAVIAALQSLADARVKIQTLRESVAGRDPWVNAEVPDEVSEPDIVY